MNQTQFLDVLRDVSESYSWTNDRGDHTATSKKRALRGVVFNPVTAVAHSITGQTFRNTKRDTQRAAKAIKMDETLANAIYSRDNRGHSQVVNGKIRKVLS